MKLVLAALALGGLAAPAVAQPAAGGQTAPASERDRLVRLLVPDATMLELAMKSLDSEAAAAPASDPAMKAYVVAQIRPELQRLLVRELPALRSEIAAILTAELTPPEIADAATFFASPTGQKIYAAAIGSLGATPGLSDDQAREAAMTAAMASLTTEDYPALMAFAASGASAKMSTINPRIGAASKAWAARLIAENGERMRGIQRRAADEYRNKAKRGAGQ
ncbi:MAG: DUF2059 domain-containing protein [Pseudomonadota bacterium]